MLLNPKTENQLESFLNIPSHGLIVYGPNGAGKQFIARTLASRLLSVSSDRLDINPNYFQLEADKSKSIGIDKVRQLKADVKLKVVSGQLVKKVILINNAEDLTIESQNALLKILEEPNEGILIILTVQNKSMLLPTIKSRVQAIDIKPVSLEDSQKYFATIEPDELEKAWRLSGGWPGLMSRLIDGDESHELIKSVELSKKLITMPIYDRLLKINELASPEFNRELFFEGLNRILTATYYASTEKLNNSQSQRILKSRIALRRSIVRNNKGQNIKLNLLQLLISL